MGQKVHPIGFRLGFNKTWDSHWYNPIFSNAGGYTSFLKEDFNIHHYIKSTVRSANLSTQLPIISRKCGTIHILLNLNFIKKEKPKRRFKLRLNFKMRYQFKFKYRNKLRFKLKSKQKLQIGPLNKISKKDVTPLTHSLKLKLEFPLLKKNIRKYPHKPWRFIFNNETIDTNRRRNIIIKRLEKFKKLKKIKALKKSKLVNILKRLKPEIKDLKIKFKKFKKRKNLKKLKFKLKNLNSLNTIKIKHLFLNQISNKLLFLKNKLETWESAPGSTKKRIKLKKKIIKLTDNFNFLNYKLKKLEDFNKLKILFHVIQLKKLKRLKLKLHKLKKNLKKFEKLKKSKETVQIIKFIQKLKLLISIIESFKLKLLNLKYNLKEITSKNLKKKVNIFNDIKPFIKNNFQFSSATSFYKLKDLLDEMKNFKNLYSLDIKKIKDRSYKIHGFIREPQKNFISTFYEISSKNEKNFNDRFSKIKSNLKFITNSNIKILMKLSRKKVNTPYNTSYLVDYLSNNLKNPQNKKKFISLYYKLYRILKAITLKLRKRKGKTKKIQGFRMKYAGKLWSKGRSKSRVAHFGPVPLQNLNEIMDYQLRNTVTKYGVTAFKIWLNYYPRNLYIKKLKNPTIRYKPFLYLLKHQKIIHNLDLLFFYYKYKLKIKKTNKKSWNKRFYLLQNYYSKFNFIHGYIKKFNKKNLLQKGI